MHKLYGTQLLVSTRFVRITLRTARIVHRFGTITLGFLTAHHAFMAGAAFAVILLGTY